MTTYNLGQKARHLLVEPIYALECDCVSASIAAQMSLEVSRLFTASYGVAVTGYAAAVPERNIDLPFAYFSICRDGEILLNQRIDVPTVTIIDNELGPMLSQVKKSNPPPTTLAALRVQLWFARQVLVALTKILSD
jgi:hypothetical protein